MENVLDSFRKLVDDTFIRYNGCIIEKASNGFILWGKFYTDLDAAKKKIDDNIKNIQNSIR